MKISVVTSFFNGDLMIPYFMSHYSYADEIIVLFNDHGKPLNVTTRKLISSYPNVRIESFAYPQKKTDYAFAVDVVNQTVAKLDSDWAIVASADELVFPVGMQGAREALRDADGEFIKVHLWWILRHRTDPDLDPTLPAIWQRRHGNPVREGVGCIKPLIIRPGRNIKFSVGGHGCYIAPNVYPIPSSIRFDGAHWLHADPTIAVQRRLRGRRENVSQRSLKDGMGVHMFNITESEELELCSQFLDAPQVF